VLVWRLDRWGRSVADLLATLQELEHLGVGFVSLTEALDLTTPSGRAMAALLAVFAEFEREILRERTRAGLAHARQNGKRLGRPHDRRPAGRRDSEAISRRHQQSRDRPPLADRAHLGAPHSGSKAVKKPKPKIRSAKIASTTKPSWMPTGPEEQAMSWYYYLESKLTFPFNARCIRSQVDFSTAERRDRRSASPRQGRGMRKRHARANPMARPQNGCPSISTRRHPSRRIHRRSHRRLALLGGSGLPVLSSCEHST
jgi:hypothetical protein